MPLTTSIKMAHHPLTRGDVVALVEVETEVEGEEVEVTVEDVDNQIMYKVKVTGIVRIQSKL